MGRDVHATQPSIFAIGTVILSYTRLYLGVHFLGDILLGSLLGTVSSLLLLASFNPILELWQRQNKLKLAAKIGNIFALLMLLFSVIYYAQLYL